MSDNGPQISVGFPPGPLALEAADLAEELGYHRFWLYDSAAIWEDVWIHMGLVAARTERMKLGTAVLVPNLRHVMTTASAIATIERMSPGRLTCGFGTGFTARRVLGHGAVTWNVMERYVRQLQALLAGEVVEIDGKPCQMIHHRDMALPRPIQVEMIMSALGPKGQAITRDLADGLMMLGPSDGTWNRFVQMMHGTVLESGESPTSERAIEAAGPWWVMLHHSSWEVSPQRLSAVPGGDDYLDRIAMERDTDQHHLAVHEGHATHITERDRILIDAAHNDFDWGRSWVAEADGIRDRVVAAGAAGAGEIIYNPAGPDPLREIRAFAEATIP
ncbi:MAG: LLM class flavin-dependent oxidoreductase [Acidimicrobiales bacterium]